VRRYSGEEDIAMTTAPTDLKPEVVEIAQHDDLTRQDWWMFVPLVAALVALPFALVAALSVGLWIAAHGLDMNVASSPQTTFAARWPDKALPETVIR
jgi:hypothetical protein